MSLTHIDIDDEALEEYNMRLLRAAAHDKYFDLAQEWDIEGAEAAHRADKEAHRA